MKGLEQLKAVTFKFLSQNGVRILKIKLKNLNDFHKTLEGLISVFFV